MKPLEMIPVGDLIVEITHDEDAGDPRKDFDQLGVMVCWHDRANLGDRQLNRRDESIPDFVAEAKREGYLVIPLWLYEHGGRTMRAGEGNPFHDQWDSGQVGFIYMTKATIAENWGTTPDREGKTPMERAEACLRAEVAEYDQWLTGDIYCYDIKDPQADPDTLESLCGCYGFDYCKEEAIEAATALNESRRQERSHLVEVLAEAMA